MLNLCKDGPALLPSYFMKRFLGIEVLYLGCMPSGIFDCGASLKSLNVKCKIQLAQSHYSSKQGHISKCRFQESEVPSILAVSKESHDTVGVPSVFYDKSSLIVLAACMVAEIAR